MQHPLGLKTAYATCTGSGALREDLSFHFDVKPTARFGGEVHQLHGGLWAVAGHDGLQDFKGTLDYIWFSPEAAHRAGLHFAPGVTCGGDHASGRRTRAEEGEKLDAWS